jgi:hypothetical protein
MLHPCCSGGLNAGKAQGKADAIRGVENNSCTSYQKAKIYVSCGEQNLASLQPWSYPAW